MASGSRAQWFQGSASDFNDGVKDDVVLDGDGGVQLKRKVADSFDDNALDAGIWTKARQSYVDAVEENHALRIKGMYSGSTDWGGWAKVTSTSSVSSMVQARLVSFTGSGVGFRTEMTLYQDASNFITMGEVHDDNIGAGTYLYLSYSIGGTSTFETWGEITSHPRVYTISLTGGSIALYLDDTEVKSIAASLSNPKVTIMGEVKTSGDSIEAQWDDVTSEYISAGMLTSSIYDTRSVVPVLAAVCWNSSLAAGTDLRFEVRSDSTASMSDPSSWETVLDGQTAGLPAVKRYLQYRAMLSTTDPLASPTLVNVTVTYEKPVSRVEVRVEGSTEWVTATGRDTWWAWLDLPENTTTIHAMVTDVAGESSEVDSTVEVDTTPPMGSILIGGGERSTADRVVNVSLEASDRYGVDRMMLSEMGDFTDAIWRPLEPRMSFVLSPGDGIKTLHARFMDGHGLESATVNASILLDTSPPVGRLSIDDGAAFTSTSVVRLSLNASDPSGVASAMLSERPDFAGAEWIPYTDGLNFTLSSPDGTKTVCAVFRDALGHVSAVTNDTIVLDTIAPRVSLTLAGGAEYVSSPEILVELGFDEADRIASIQVGGDNGLAGAPIQPPSASLQWTFGGTDGRKVLFARAVDLAGNAGPIASAAVMLDTIAPSVAMTIDGGAPYTREHLVTIALVVDDASPVTTMEVGSDPALPGALPRAFASSSTFVLPGGEGTRTVYARVRDAAGNVAPTAQASIVVDSTPPVLTLSLPSNATLTTSGNVSVHLTVEDAAAAAWMQYGEDADLADVDLVPFRENITWTLSKSDGRKDLYVRVVDPAGNQGEIVSCSVTLDTTLPSSAVTPLANVSAKEDIVVSWRGVDATSGIAGYDIQYQEDGGPWMDLLAGTASTCTTFEARDGHTYCFRVRALDRAGNLEPYPGTGSVSVRVDVPEPEKALSGQALPLVLIAAIAAACVVGAIVVMARRRRSRR